MLAVRRALRTLRELDLDVFEGDRQLVVVDRGGQVLLDPPGGPLQTSEGQFVERELLDVVAPFYTLEGLRGPHLQSPRPQLRIVPLKLAGSPHLDGTRIETRALAALADRGYEAAQIAAFYPSVELSAIHEALDLERQLAFNLGHVA